MFKNKIVPYAVCVLALVGSVATLVATPKSEFYVRLGIQMMLASVAYCMLSFRLSDLKRELFGKRLAVISPKSLSRLQRAMHASFLAGMTGAVVAMFAYFSHTQVHLALLSCYMYYMVGAVVSLLVVSMILGPSRRIAR